MPYPVSTGHHTSDTDALDRIAAVMSDCEDWSPDTLDMIAALVRSTGRDIADSAKYED